MRVGGLVRRAKGGLVKSGRAGSREESRAKADLRENFCVVVSLQGCVR